VLVSCAPMATELEELSAKQLKKLEKSSDNRTLEPWERYRALVDLYEAFFDMNELADRKTRFALVMMGALNALNLILGTQRMFADLTTAIRPFIGGYFMIYAAVSLYFFIQAIATLRPRISMFPGALKPGQPPARAGLRFIGDVVGTDGSAYYDRWTSVQLGDLCKETAEHVQVMGRVTDAKFKALEGVYNGLTAMTALSALMVIALSFFYLTS
jgi:hypothetical protein